MSWQPSNDPVLGDPATCDALDLVIVRRDECRISSHVDIDGTNEYFHRIRERWGEALREIFCDLPNPDWLMSSPPEPGRLAPPVAPTHARLQSRK